MLCVVVVLCVLCVLCCVVCRCGRGVVGGRGVCSCVAARKKRGKTRVWIQKRISVYIQNVPVCTGTMRTCVSQHVPVVPVHMGTF